MDGLVVVGFPVSELEQERLALMGVHIVAAGGQVAPYPYVSIDDQAAGTQAMNHLLNLGHRRIAMIDTTDPNASEWPVDGRALARGGRGRGRSGPVRAGALLRTIRQPA